MKITRTAAIPHGTTVGELAAAIYHDITYDISLPQEWLNQVEKSTGVYLAGSVVWGYPTAFRMFGCPLPLTVEAADLLAEYTGLADSEGSHPMDPWTAIVDPRMDRTT